MHRAAGPAYLRLIYPRHEQREHRFRAMGIGIKTQNVARSARWADVPGAWTRLRDQKAAYSGPGSASKPEGGRHVSHGKHFLRPVRFVEASPTAVESLKMLLDYAIAEGSELRLPVFVLLLKMADLELAKSARVRYQTADAPSMRDAGERVAP
jgi:hypothetical protein